MQHSNGRKRRPLSSVCRPNTPDGLQAVQVRELRLLAEGIPQNRYWVIFAACA
jgi:hypothetical protein